jgi:peptidoglycan-associated lipoprotein
MKNVVMSSVVLALLVFSGCSSKDQKIAEVSAPVEEVVKQEPVVSSDTQTMSSNEMSSSELMAKLEKDLSTIYFDFDKFFIRADMKSNVSTDATVANGPAKAFTIKLEGNCDEWGSDEYNFALGLKRANEVKKALIAEGVDTARITMVSFGESNAVCTDKTQDCWAKNRRVDFKLLP